MRNFIRALKALAYLASVVLPLIDAIKGVKNGIKLGLQDKKERDELVAKSADDALRNKIQKGFM